MKFLKLSFFLSLILAANLSKAADLSENEIRGLTNYFSQFVQITKRPFYVYNWFKADKDSFFLQPLKSDGPEGFQDVQQMAQKHWGAGHFTGEQANFGAGLYTALDPYASRGYGGGADSWVLTQIQIPRGARVINLNVISYTRVDEIPDDVFNLLRKSECGSFFSQGMGPRTILSFMLGDHVGRDERSDECFRLSREIFNERLKIDLVGYSFSRSVLPTICPNLKADEKREVDSVRRSYRNGKTGFVSPDLVAFIILRSEPFSRNDVRIYNYQSTDDEAARSHIQSLYLSSQGVDLSRPLWQNLKSADKADLVRWARGNIFGCDSSVDFGL